MLVGKSSISIKRKCINDTLYHYHHHHHLYHDKDNDGHHECHHDMANDDPHHHYHAKDNDDCWLENPPLALNGSVWPRWPLGRAR